ncbi:PREDICTED: phospholipase A1-like [Cyphomyrmex costatus]|uniref:phospholipase A1-like n=1 Tax=Cyphomyrmex costatus TaxID=456900 RepID=UPI0008522666|nr:PREDICTED: phospholipase A1-like [Cyphomyrmex costatus]
MMQLVTIALSLILFCSLFGIIEVASHNHDAVTVNDVLVNEDNSADNQKKKSTSCVFGVKSVSMTLFTSDNGNGKFEVNESYDVLDRSKPVYFVVHGFISNDSPFNLFDLVFLLSKENTVFSLNWSDTACYNNSSITKLLSSSAVKNTRDIGDYLASYTLSLIEYGVPLKNITYIGYSLGAHVIGFAAKKLQMLNMIIPRLIGVDPLAYGFMFNKCENRLCYTDAQFVTVLYTSPLSIQKSVGQLNLWFNNGAGQPYCGDALINNSNIKCSHSMSIIYFINIWSGDCEFLGVPINKRTNPLLSVPPGCSINRIGSVIVDNKIFKSNSTIVGDYCIPVTSEYPYCTKKNLKNLKRCEKYEIIDNNSNTSVLL